MATNTVVNKIYEASSKLAKYPFEPYWPEKKLKICVTGAGGFIARYILFSYLSFLCSINASVHPDASLTRDTKKEYLSIKRYFCSHLAKRLKSEGHYIIGCDWKRNEHMPVSANVLTAFAGSEYISDVIKH